MPTKKKQKNKEHNPFRISPTPTCLALRAILCCVCMSASLSGTSIVTCHTNPHIDTSDTPTATPTQNVDQRAWTNGSDKHKRNDYVGKDLEPKLEHRQNKKQKNENMPLATIGNPAEGEEAAPITLTTLPSSIYIGKHLWLPWIASHRNSRCPGKL